MFICTKLCVFYFMCDLMVFLKDIYEYLQASSYPTTLEHDPPVHAAPLSFCTKPGSCPLTDSGFRDNTVQSEPSAMAFSALSDSPCKIDHFSGSF